jgi:predicted enzyme related to lactoylglutathione lyase
MPEPKGTFGWYELMTTDTAAAEAFYTSVVGWTSTNVGTPEMPYTTFNARGVGMAGMLTIPADAAAMGACPSWIGYIHVDDVDAYVTQVVDAGGSVVKPATDVPGMLRFAVMQDAEGVHFVLFTSNPAMTSPADRPVPPEIGTISWHELCAVDGAAAFEWYSKLFGWTKGADMDMGPMGLYQMFNVGGQDIGGIMTKPASVPAPFWTYYFQVDGCAASIERLTKGGGKVINGPHQVPGGMWIVQAIDPQGAMFALVSLAA